MNWATIAADNQQIVENGLLSRPLLVISPAGQEWSLNGIPLDVGQTIDPDTGQAVAGRRASVSVSMASLPTVPELSAESGGKPWRVRLTDLDGNVLLWKVTEVLPDRFAHKMVFLLEAYYAA